MTKTSKLHELLQLNPPEENSALEGLRASSKEEIALKLRSLLAESQKELLKLLKSK